MFGITVKAAEVGVFTTPTSARAGTRSLHNISATAATPPSSHEFAG